MSGATSSKDAPLSQLTASSDEQPNQRRSDADCQICRNLRLPEPYRITTTYARLQGAAADGCELCDLLRQASEMVCIDVDLAILDSDGIDIYPRTGKAPEDTAQLAVWWHEKYNGIQTRNIHILPGEECPWPFLASETSLHDNRTIEDCVNFITSTLKRCNINHKRCATYDVERSSMSTHTAKFNPRRLLYIGENNSLSQVRLCEPTGDALVPNERGVQYTALSHCWGSTPIIKTTSTTLTRYIEDGIPWLDLPKTFQEAILLARGLKVNYIWIDSLCIIQDSVSDWAQQSSPMADIFSNAYLTIGASAAENGQQGLLNRRKIHNVATVFNGKTYNFCVRHPWRHELIHREGHNPLRTGSDMLLRRRAWCFQEEMLSTRVVHFTRDEIFFICYEATACECTPGWRSRFKLPSLIAGQSESYERWCSIVQHYTWRDISFHKDRLPALSSLTRLLGAESDEYLAGHWKSHMPRSLLWWADGGSRSEPCQPSQSDPPSWSWASFEGAVGFVATSSHTHGHSDEVAEVLAVQVYPSTDDPRGMVSGGYITLRTPLFPLEEWKSNDQITTFRGGVHESLGYYNGTCKPGWGCNNQWSEKDICRCVLDHTDEFAPLASSGVCYTPTFPMVVRKDYGPFRDKDIFDGIPGSEQVELENSELETVTLVGLLLKPLEDFNPLQARILENLESKLAFVRIGMGSMRLTKEYADEALNRFANTTVTIF